MMFVAHAGDFIQSEVFVLKMGLVLAAGVNAAVFHAGAFRASADTWPVNSRSASASVRSPGDSTVRKSGCSR